MIELLGSNRVFVLLSGFMCLTGLSGWNLPILGGMLNWSHAAFTRLTGNCINLSLFFLLRCLEVCRGNTEVTEDANITILNNEHVQALLYTNLQRIIIKLMWN